MLGMFAPGTGGEKGSASSQHLDPPATVQTPNPSAHLQHTWLHFFCPSCEWHLCARCRLETGSWLLEPVVPAVT